MLALKKGNRSALVLGVSMIAGGLAYLPFCRSRLPLLISFLLIGAGFGALAFGILMSVLSPVLKPSTAATVSGIISASSGLGSIVFAPLWQKIIAGSGITVCLRVMAIAMAVMIPVSLYFTRFESKPAARESAPAIIPMFKAAFADPSYRLMMCAFFTCGFHMAIIETHLFNNMTAAGLQRETAAYILSVYGISTMLGSVFSGAMTGRFRPKMVAGLEFGSRTIWILLYFILPKTIVTFGLFAILLGFTGAATVPPVSAMVKERFGAVKMATLFGFLFVFHQLGSFFSSWLGGISVEATCGYTVIWSASALLAAFAASCCFRVRDAEAQN
ncbi:MAG: hypothetical protein IKI65_01595 [Firmicutes bacterium]|nr:hypothetical protein [Bacillota bacterium]